MSNLDTVPNQRIVTVHKEICNSANRYTTNNLVALDEAAYNLQTKGGFKLYIYLAKNQDKYNFALSSSDFCGWSGLGITAYRTAFNELSAKGYLIQKEKDSNIYTFYDKSQKKDKEMIDNVTIEYAKTAHNKNDGFCF